MRQEVVIYLQQHPDLRRFIRQHPFWYRRLSRDPDRLQEMTMEARRFYGKTFSQRIDRLQQQIDSAAMMMEMVRHMGSAD
ncbi:YlbE-like family protein [Texcoconibacillus texcoconensis]|uniref:YlbE-like protein n=1 Tax=Texcoconibacillus texcoconensis TaxID=1095777 RepID=A0A840QLG3_9BACI|nr:YlbE-like family protein [Texcoconibacillus texcoconensis]MBB5172203.1 hypothetical protein [Texcoconibacillus texcoconensis]